MISNVMFILKILFINTKTEFYLHTARSSSLVVTRAKSFPCVTDCNDSRHIWSWWSVHFSSGMTTATKDNMRFCKRRGNTNRSVYCNIYIQLSKILARVTTTLTLTRITKITFYSCDYCLSVAFYAFLHVLY